jgi:hypothetical protein
MKYDRYVIFSIRDWDAYQVAVRGLQDKRKDSAYNLERGNKKAEEFKKLAEEFKKGRSR